MEAGMVKRTRGGKSPAQVAAAISTEIEALDIRNTPNVRAVRRRYSRVYKDADPEFILELARKLAESYGYRWVACELVRDHKVAFRSLGEAEVEEFGQAMDSWGGGRLLRAHSLRAGLAPRAGLGRSFSPLGPLGGPLVAARGAGEHGRAQRAEPRRHRGRFTHPRVVPVARP